MIRFFVVKVGNYLRCFRGSLYKKYPGLSRLVISIDCVMIDYCKNWCNMRMFSLIIAEF